MTAGVGHEEALERAVQALVDGPADGTSIEGAKVNALESIAWSLIGLLAKDTGRDEETLSGLAARAGFMAEIER